MSALVYPKRAAIIIVEEIKDELINMGAAEVGIGDVRKGLSKELLHMPMAISIGVKASFFENNGEKTGLQEVEESEKLLEMLQRYVIKVLKASGYRCLAIPPNTQLKDEKFISRLYRLFSHKVAATCAGLGWIGKNGLLVSKKYGPRLIWATVLTDAQLEISGKPIVKGKCGNCRKCVDICPARAIPDREWVLEKGLVTHINVDACKKYLEKKLLQTGNSYCGLCIAVCPIGLEVKWKVNPFPSLSHQ